MDLSNLAQIRKEVLRALHNLSAGDLSRTVGLQDIQTHVEAGPEQVSIAAKQLAGQGLAHFSTLNGGMRITASGVLATEEDAGLEQASSVGRLKATPEERAAGPADAILDELLYEQHESFRSAISAKLAEFGGRGMLHSSTTIHFLEQSAAKEIRAVAAQIGKRWISVLHASGTDSLNATLAADRAVRRLREEADRVFAEIATSAPKIPGTAPTPPSDQLARSEKRLRQEIEEAGAPGRVESTESGDIPVPAEHGTVFIVHGHDHAAKEMVARFVQDLGLTPIILHEQPSRGQTIIEKLEANSRVGFAVVLLTPDDEGGSATSTQRKKRARQNVVFELGYFIGLLKRARVAALYHDAVELPTDYTGVAWIGLNGNWKAELAKELRAAGLSINANALL